jgi:hypothetical protein
MPTASDYTFPVVVRDQMWDAPEDQAPLYRNIYDVILRSTVTVTFVPDIGRGVDSWPPILPEDVKVFDERIARLESIEQARYAITPDHERAGQHEQIVRSIQDPDTGRSETTETTIFYIQPEVFHSCLQELAGLSEEIGGARLARPINELTNLTIMRVLVTDIISSDAFSANDRAWLLSARDTAL